MNIKMKSKLIIYLEMILAFSRHAAVRNPPIWSHILRLFLLPI